MSKLKDIVNGWKNYLFEDPEVEKIAKERAEICADCDHAVDSFYEVLLLDNTLGNIQGMICDLCKCPLSTKCRSLEGSCDLNLWK